MDDPQLQAANHLLQWMRQASDLHCTLHPALIVKRDQYNGLGLFVRSRYEVDAALKAHIAAQGLNKWLGVAPDELLFAIPRSAMLEAPEGSHDEQQQQHAGEANAPLASLLAHLAASQQHLGAASSASEEQTGRYELIQHYLASIPADLADVLPILWAVDPLLPRGHQQGTPPAHSALQLARERLQHLKEVVLPSASMCQALQQQLDALRPHLMAAGHEVDWHVFKGQCDQAHEPDSSQQQAQGSEYIASVGVHANRAALQCWAQGVCQSRAIHLWGGPSLVPLADFMNHSHPPNVMCMARARDDDDQHEDAPVASCQQVFECYAVKPLAPGQELHWVYLAHTHDAGWLSCYGFVPQDGSSSFPHTGHVILPPPTPPHTDSTSDDESPDEGVEDDKKCTGSIDESGRDAGVSGDKGQHPAVQAARIEPTDIPALLAQYDVALEKLHSPDLAAPCQMPPGLKAGFAALLSRERQAVVHAAAKGRR